MRSFEYLKPTSVQEALGLLALHREKAKIIAGGTDLMILWKKKLVSPDFLISLRNIPELNFIELGERLKIGAATTHRTLELSPVIRGTIPALWDAVCNIGSVQVRSSGTIGGNLCNAAPSADTAPPMLVLEAEVAIAGPEGERLVPIEEFFMGPGRTVVAPGEMVTHFALPLPLPRTGMAYWKHTRRKAMDLPILGVAMCLTLAEDMKTCVKARIGLGVASPVPMRARKAEAFIEGKLLDEGTLAEAGEIASSGASPRTTIRGSRWYRSDMIRVLVKRTGALCLERAAMTGADNL